jgi:NitT/TauT family transport system ATP-binding protein
VLGPSGCGKTTLLRLAASLVEPDGGRVHTSRPPDEPIGFVFQESRLLPWKTALENITYVMPRDWTREYRQEEALRLLAAVELEDCATHLPGTLSGGMARRVALARALASPARLLLFDEAFSSLDIDLKRRLVRRIRREARARHQSVLCATHDLDTALRFADRIVLLSVSPVRILEDIAAAGDRDGREAVPAETYARAERVLAGHE